MTHGRESVCQCPVTHGGADNLKEPNCIVCLCLKDLSLCLFVSLSLCFFVPLSLCFSVSQPRYPEHFFKLYLGIPSPGPGHSGVLRVIRGVGNRAASQHREQGVVARVAPGPHMRRARARGARPLGRWAGHTAGPLRGAAALRRAGRRRAPRAAPPRTPCRRANVLAPGDRRPDVLGSPSPFGTSVPVHSVLLY